MKTNTIFSLLLASTMIGVVLDAGAQNRRREEDGNRERQNNNEDRNRNERNNYHDNGNRHDRDRSVDRRSDSRGNYDRQRYNDRRPVVTYYHQRPRYVYYKEYDVYYDCQKSVYITYSGRSWTVSTAIPRSMRYINPRQTRRYEVDYYDDDFPRYLERQRPTCGQEYDGW